LFSALFIFKAPPIFIRPANNVFRVLSYARVVEVKTSAVSSAGGAMAAFSAFQASQLEHFLYR
jgi:hypothetical protein